MADPTAWTSAGLGEFGGCFQQSSFRRFKKKMVPPTTIPITPMSGRRRMPRSSLLFLSSGSIAHLAAFAAAAFSEPPSDAELEQQWYVSPSPFQHLEPDGTGVEPSVQEVTSTLMLHAAQQSFPDDVCAVSARQ